MKNLDISELFFKNPYKIATGGKPIQNKKKRLQENSHTRYGHYGDETLRKAMAVFDEKIWVIHAFKKKSKTGIKTPKPETDLIKKRIKVLKEMLK